MGKFGKRRLPKFMEQPKAHDLNVNAPANEEIDLADPDQRREAGKALKSGGLLPGSHQLVEPVVLKSYSSNPEDMQELANAGYEIKKKKDSELIAKIKTVDDEETVLVFEADQEDGEKDEDHRGYMWCDAVAEHEGWEYRIPIYLYTLNDSIEEAEYENITAEHITENKLHEMKKAVTNFDAFVAISEGMMNEDDTILPAVNQQTAAEPQPCEGCTDHPDTLSESAKAAIKQVCETVLIKEAHVYETSEDENQTYETFLKECTHYMAECLIRASQNLKL